MEKPDVGVEGQGLGTAVSSTLGAGGGVSETAPSILSCILRYKMVKVVKYLSLQYDRFYQLRLLPIYTLMPWDVQEVAKLCTIPEREVEMVAEELSRFSKVWEVEADNMYNKLLEVYVNIPFDITDKDMESLRRLVQLALPSRPAPAVEEKLEVKTRSGRTVYIKTKGDKIIVSGDTYHVKEELKKLGLKWDPMEKVWYALSAKIDVNTLKARLEGV
jgi:hypothetical protein